MYFLESEGKIPYSTQEDRYRVQSNILTDRIWQKGHEHDHDHDDDHDVNHDYHHPIVHLVP